MCLDGDDRLEEQLEYEPNSRKVKTILLLDEHKAWQNSGIESGKGMFLKKKCPIDTCSISYNPKTLDKADLVISGYIIYYVWLFSRDSDLTTSVVRP